MHDVPDNTIHPTTRAEWRAWLAQHHTHTKGVWLITSKKGSGKPGVAYDDAVEEALCFRWIDSQPRTLDDERAMLWFAPRKPGTGWSKLNEERIERLLAAGLMTPAGLAKVEAAPQAGSWHALDAVEALDIPPDLAAAGDGAGDAQGAGALRASASGIASHLLRRSRM